MKMGQFLPIINHKSAMLAVLSLIVLIIHLIAMNVVRGQIIERLRTKRENIGEFIIFMTSSLIIVLFGGIFSIVYATRFETTIASTLLEQIQHYDDNSSNSRAFVDHLQASLACCGVHGMKDYEDLSQVDLIWNVNTLKRDTTLQGCSAEAKVCVFPLSCCRSLECTEYGELQLPNTDGEEDFHEKWYQKQGCLSAILETDSGALQPYISIILIFSVFILEVLAIIFSQLTLTAYLVLWESGLSESENSIAWIFPCAFPTVDEIIEELATSQTDSNSVIDDRNKVKSGVNTDNFSTDLPNGKMDAC